MKTVILDMPFHNTLGKSVTLTVENPRAGLSLVEVAAVMNDIVTRNIFTSTGGDFTEIGAPFTRTTEITMLT